MAGESVLIIEDDKTMLRALKDNFQYEGYVVSAASDGEAGLEAALSARPNLIILDIMLPKANGYEVCRLIRQEGLKMPVIMLTAKGQEPDVILGLNLGADDYVTKPFSVKELLARANALLRRTRHEEKKTYRFAEFTLDAASRRLLKKGKEVVLAPKEYALLEYLLRNAGRALTRDQILKAVWGYDVFVTRRSVDRCVNTLRAKIERAPDSPAWLKTVREIGYRFEVPEAR